MFSIGKDAACSHSIDHSQENIPIKKKRQNQGENKKTRKKKKKKAPRTESNSFLHQRPPCRSHLRLVSLCASSGSSRSLFPQRFISATERMCAHEKFGFRRETSSSRLLRGMLTWTGMSQKGEGEEGRGLGVNFFRAWVSSCFSSCTGRRHVCALFFYFIQYMPSNAKTHTHDDL